VKSRPFLGPYRQKSQPGRAHLDPYQDKLVGLPRIIPMRTSASQYWVQTGSVGTGESALFSAAEAGAASFCRRFSSFLAFFSSSLRRFSN